MGDQIELTDGKGNLALAEVTGADASGSTFRMIRSSHVPRRGFTIHLAIAPTKQADRMEWMVEKCVEIGIDRISFVRCQTSERKEQNTERLFKIAVSAIKQSRQPWLPELSSIEPLTRFLESAQASQKFIAHVDENNPRQLKQLARPGMDTLVLVGPEGDFTATELDLALAKGWTKVSLGPNRLRTETAGLAAVMTLQLINIS